MFCCQLTSLILSAVFHTSLISECLFVNDLSVFGWNGSFKGRYDG